MKNGGELSQEESPPCNDSEIPLFRHEGVQQQNDFLLETLARNNAVYKSMIQKEFRRLEAWRQLRLRRIFDDTRPREADHCLWLRKNDIA